MNQKVIQLIAAAIDPDAYRTAKSRDNATDEARINALAKARHIVACLKSRGFEICTAEERRILESLP